MKTVKVYCGETIQHKCCSELHPVAYVKKANAIILSEQDEVVFTNNPDLVMGLKYIGKKHNVNVEFFLNGVSSMDDIEPVFTDFNRSLGLINELGSDEE